MKGDQDDPFTENDMPITFPVPSSVYVKIQDNPVLFVPNIPAGAVLDLQLHEKAPKRIVI